MIVGAPGQISSESQFPPFIPAQSIHLSMMMMLMLPRLLFSIMSMALLLPTAMAFTTSSSLIPFPATTAIRRHPPSPPSRVLGHPAPRLLGPASQHHSSSTTALSTLSTPSSVSATTTRANQPTELPDSLDDAASIAANACYELYQTSASGSSSSSSTTTMRCRVDFDTSIGDETYTLLKGSTEFTQKFVSALCMQCIDGVRAYMLERASRLATARVELKDVRRQ